MPAGQTAIEALLAIIIPLAIATSIILPLWLLKKKHTYKEVLAFTIFTAGALKSFILPLFAIPFIRVPPWVGLDQRLFVPIILFGALPLVGIIYILAKGIKFTPRSTHNWKVYLGILFIIATISPILLNPLTKIVPWPASLFEEIYSLSETPFYAVALGILLIFFKIEDQEKFMLFLAPMGIAWLLYPLGAILNQIVPIPGFPAYSATWWMDPWFWGDQIFDIGWGIIVALALLRRNIVRTRKGL